MQTSFIIFLIISVLILCAIYKGVKTIERKRQKVDIQDEIEMEAPNQTNN